MGSPHNAPVCDTGVVFSFPGIAQRSEEDSEDHVFRRSRQGGGAPKDLQSGWKVDSVILYRANLTSNNLLHLHLKL